MHDLRNEIFLKSLMALSSNCTQAIRHKCQINGLTGFSSWLGADGIQNSYWHGDKNSGKFSNVSYSILALAFSFVFKIA